MMPGHNFIKNPFRHHWKNNNHQCADNSAGQHRERENRAAVLRRNVIVSRVDLLSLIGSEFEIQGVKLRGTQHCAPCEWMDVVIAPGAKEFLKENGGLRAKILTDGELHLGDAQRRIVKDVEAQAAAKA